MLDHLDCGIGLRPNVQVGYRVGYLCTTITELQKNERLGGSRHSDKEKFRSELNGPKTPKMSE
jgi:hypothetical protein